MPPGNVEVSFPSHPPAFGARQAPLQTGRVLSSFGAIIGTDAAKHTSSAR
jgi:hypothetical protein